MKQTLPVLFASLLVFLFSYTAISKLADIQLYTHDMHKQPMAGWLATLLVWLIPSIEISLVVLLLRSRTRGLGFWLSAGMLAVFTMYVVLVLARAFGSIPCSCGGLVRTFTWQQHLWLNAGFFLVAVAGGIIETKHEIFIAINRRSRKPGTE